jgi:hypothetical protein
MMEKTFRPFQHAGRALALATLFAAGTVALQAQTAAAPTLNLNLPAAATPAFSSSVPENEVALNTLPLNVTGLNAMQYGGRRRSGRPRYRDGNTNADGSQKWGAFVGGGFNAPVQDTETYNTPSWGFGGGVTRNFDKHVGAQVEFNYDNFGLQGSTLANQTNLYNYYISQCNASPSCVASAGGTVSPISGLDGSTHVWSFAINPTYQIHSGEGLGAYVLGGVGFYHKVTNFTVPAAGIGYDYYCGCYYQYSANQIYDHYFSNAAGLDGGIGLTYKFSRFSNERFYAEARYVYIFNPYRPGYTSANVTTTTADYGANDYPANSLRTSYFPIKFGIRF